MAEGEGSEGLAMNSKTDRFACGERGEETYKERERGRRGVVVNAGNDDYF